MDEDLRFLRPYSGTSGSHGIINKLRKKKLFPISLLFVFAYRLSRGKMAKISQEKTFRRI